MKIQYYTVTFNFKKETGYLNLEGGGISIEFRINETEKNQLLDYLLEIKKTDKTILREPFKVTERLLQEGLLPGIEQWHLEKFWETVNNLYLGPYRVLLLHSGETEKQRKALRDFFKPIRFRLRSVQTVMEAENKTTIQTQLQEII